MADVADTLDIEQLKDFVPLFSLSPERLRELAALATTEVVRPGVHLFHEGEVDNRTLYLMRGQVRLLGNGESPETVVASGTPEARHPLADSQPRRVSGVAQSEVTLLCIDNNVLDYMITWDQLAALEQSPVDGWQAGVPGEDTGWMSRVEDSLQFRNVPSPNVQELLDRMDALRVGEGEVIVRQGEPGDYYYLIQEGRALVTQQVVLAELGEGAAFGEEALVADTARNATVTMATDGVLLRLSKEDFNELLKQPLLNWVSPLEARERVNNGAVWLDVRHAREYSHYRLPNAINVPLHELRDRIGELDPAVSYICYCKTGRRSSAAAFLLSKNGYDVSVLRGGLQVLPPLVRQLGEGEEG